jgi:hypothetical protein
MGDGHQFRWPRGVAIAGTSNVRTKNVPARDAIALVRIIVLLARVSTRTAILVDL